MTAFWRKADVSLTCPDYNILTGAEWGNRSYDLRRRTTLCHLGSDNPSRPSTRLPRYGRRRRCLVGNRGGLIRRFENAWTSRRTRKARSLCRQRASHCPLTNTPALRATSGSSFETEEAPVGTPGLPNGRSPGGGENDRPIRPNSDQSPAVPRRGR